MVCSFASSLSVLAPFLLLTLGSALVLPQLGLCVATMSHSVGQENFVPSLLTPTLTYEYGIFVSFHVEDTLTSFTGHLFAAFERKRIRAYRGEFIQTELMKAIETSRIAIVVFSKNYVASNSCLDELVKIIECKRLLNQRVVPIFYDVSPSKVRKEGENLAEGILNGPEDKVKIWKTALTNVANLAGFHLKHRLEPEFIEEIVESIWKILRETNPKETNSSRSLAPPHLATKACSSGPSLSVLVALLLGLGIALVLPQLVLRVATMTHFKGPTLTYEYDVFVSFRGDDSRRSFTAYLFHALDRKRIVAYRDDINLPRGGEIGPELLKVIETSRIAVVVFSKNYANSDWCLDELVKIMECRRLLNQRVLPIFYDVSPSMVRNELGNRAEAILNGPEENLNIWKATLTNVANLAGLHLHPYRSEPEFMEEIVEEIWKMLHEGSLTNIVVSIVRYVIRIVRYLIRIVRYISYRV